MFLWAHPWDWLHMACSISYYTPHLQPSRRDKIQYTNPCFGQSAWWTLGQRWKSIEHKSSRYWYYIMLTHFTAPSGPFFPQACPYQPSKQYFTSLALPHVYVLEQRDHWSSIKRIWSRHWKGFLWPTLRLWNPAVACYWMRFHTGYICWDIQPLQWIPSWCISNPSLSSLCRKLPAGCRDSSITSWLDSSS